MLVLLSSVLGLLSLFPESKIKKIKIAQDQELIKNNLGNNLINCSTSEKSELSVIIDNQKNTNQESCLFVGCSGFNF